MEDSIKSIELLIKNSIEYSKTSFEIIKLKTADSIAEGLSTFLPILLGLVLISFVCLFASIGLAIWIGLILGNLYLGLFIIAGFFGILSIILFFGFRKCIKRMVSNQILRKIIK